MIGRKENSVVIFRCWPRLIFFIELAQKTTIVSLKKDVHSQKMKIEGFKYNTLPSSILVHLISLWSITFTSKLLRSAYGNVYALQFHNLILFHIRTAYTFICCWTFLNGDWCTGVFAFQRKIIDMKNVHLKIVDF